jgi:predicted SPOUT superfamily RNA methylase MTH1
MSALCLDAAVVSGHCGNTEQLTYAAYQIARNAVLYKVSEIILLEAPTSEASADAPPYTPAVLLGALLQYFVTPRYLAKESFRALFAAKLITPKLFGTASRLPALPGLLDTLAPWTGNEKGRYREGLTVGKSIALKMGPGVIREKTASGKVKKVKKNKNKTPLTRHVLVGRSETVEVTLEADQNLPLGVRVLVDTVEKKIVPARAYTGYTVRIVAQYDPLGVFTGYTGAGEGYAGAVWVPCAEPVREAGKAEAEVEAGDAGEVPTGSALSPLVFIVGAGASASARAKNGAGAVLSEACDAQRPSWAKRAARVEDAVAAVLARAEAHA